MTKRPQLSDFFTDENLIADSVKTETCSPYVLWKAQYTTGPNSWAVTRAKVTRITDGPDATPLVDMQRNYSSLWHVFILDHARSGHDYFLSSEDYFGGYTIFDLTNGDAVRYTPDKGGDWCWDTATPSPGGTHLAIDGCYWASTWTTRIYDFSQPDIVPLPLLWDGERPENFWAIGGGVQRWEGEDQCILDCFQLDTGGMFAKDPRPEEELGNDDDGMLHRQIVLNIVTGKWQERGMK